jgi:hypothetical protein
MAASYNCHRLLPELADKFDKWGPFGSERRCETLLSEGERETVRE